MISNEELERVRSLFQNDRFATEAGAVIDEIGDHYAKVSLSLNEHHKNAAGGIMAEFISLSPTLLLPLHQIGSRSEPYQ